MDAGGSDKDPIDGIREKGIRYPIRIRMNRSDEKMIYEHLERIQYIGGGRHA